MTGRRVSDPDRPRSSAPGAGDRGSVSAELVVFVVPVMILLTMFITFCGRAASASIDVNSLAAAAARAAADSPTRVGAIAAATAAVATGAGGKWRCTPTVNTATFRLGGQVTVDVTCRVPFSDLGVPGMTAFRDLRHEV